VNAVDCPITCVVDKMNETSIPRQRPVLKPTIILLENNMNAYIKARIYALYNSLLLFNIKKMKANVRRTEFIYKTQ
jgi:hypothetical protein